MRLVQKLVLTLALVGAAGSASAFSLLGPFDAWQTGPIGYDPFNSSLDLGGPMNLTEEYRWNSAVITYAFDPSFVAYFGPKGMNAINQVFAILNGLPAMSTLSSNLTEFPLDTQRVNYEASALNIFDLKSFVLALMMEQLGVANPERFTWTLRDRRPIAGTPNFQYLVIKRSFDPATYAPSSYVNGTLYTYRIEDPIPIAGGGFYADAVEIPVDPLAFGFTSVASAVTPLWGGTLVLPGEFVTGLTRDDVGALRYLYAGGKNKGPNARRINLNIENLAPGSTGSVGGSPWSPGGGGAPVPVGLAVRPGVDKILFKQLKFTDGGFGFFIAATNMYKDTYMTNSRIVTQRVERAATTGPDILFTAGQTQLGASGLPVLVNRNLNFVNNAALNGTGFSAGPGTMSGPITIELNNTGPFIVNQSPNFIDEASGSIGFAWGSYDGTTNPPTVYPDTLSVQDLVQQVLSGGN